MFTYIATAMFEYETYCLNSVISDSCLTSGKSYSYNVILHEKLTFVMTQKPFEIILQSCSGLVCCIHRGLCNFGHPEPIIKSYFLEFHEITLENVSMRLQSPYCNHLQAIVGTQTRRCWNCSLDIWAPSCKYKRLTLNKSTRTERCQTYTIHTITSADLIIRSIL